MKALSRQHAIERLAGRHDRAALRRPDVHAERFADRREVAARCAVTDDADPLAVELPPRDRLVIPAGFVLLLDEPPEVARDRDHARDRVLGHRGCVHARAVRDDDTALGELGRDEGVDARPRRVDPAQLRHSRNELAKRERPVVAAIDGNLDVVERRLSLLPAQRQELDATGADGFDAVAELLRQCARDGDRDQTARPSPPDRAPTRTCDSDARADSSSSGM